MSVFARGAVVVACLTVLGAVGCGEEATPPEAMPGELAVSVLSPNGAEGAAVLETADEGILEITANVGRAFHFRAGGSARIVVLLDEPGAIEFILSVQDLNRAPRLRIVEVADAENRLRLDLRGYRVEMEPRTGA